MDWLSEMKALVDSSSRSGGKGQLPPLPDLTGATRDDKAVLLFTRGIQAAELGDMNTAEAMVRYALKICPQLSAPMSEWPDWAKKISQRMLAAQAGSKVTSDRQTGDTFPATPLQPQSVKTENSVQNGSEVQLEDHAEPARTDAGDASSVWHIPSGLIPLIILGAAGLCLFWRRSRGLHGRAGML